jgi:prevent-host-death family protein
MPKRWQLQEAKNRFSEVVDLALEEGPQSVTRHGKDVVVVVSKDDFERRRRATGPKGTLLAFLRRLSFADASLHIDRSRDDDRALDL